MLLMLTPKISQVAGHDHTAVTTLRDRQRSLVEASLLARPLDRASRWDEATRTVYPGR
jgi:hypothetical protein